MVQLAALVAETAPRLMNTVFCLCSSYIHRKRWSFHQSLLYLWKSSRIHCGWNRESWWIHSLDGSKCCPPVEHHPAVMGRGKPVDSVVQAVIWRSQSSAPGTWPQPQPFVLVLLLPLDTQASRSRARSTHGEQAHDGQQAAGHTVLGTAGRDSLWWLLICTTRLESAVRYDSGTTLTPSKMSGYGWRGREGAWRDKTIYWQNNKGKINLYDRWERRFTV